MPTVFTVSLCRARFNAPGFQVLRTVQAGEFLIVRDVLVSNLDSAPKVLYFYVQSGSNSFYIVMQPAAAPNTVYHFDGRVALEAGDELVGYSDGAAWTVEATGYDFSS